MKTLRTLINGAIAGTGTAFAGLVLATGLMALPVETAHAQWFKCSSGTLQTQGSPANKARCQVRVQPDAGCPNPAWYKRDAQGNTDRCVPPMGPDGEASCGLGQVKEVRQGADRCYTISPVNTPG
jgi:hypothetical protein